MAEVAVSVAIFLAQEVLSFLRQRNNCYTDVHEKAKNFQIFLEILAAHLKNTEGSQGGGRFKAQPQPNHFREIAYDIEDVLDEFMLHASVSHHYIVSMDINRLGHNARHWSAHRKILRKMDNIQATINQVEKANSFFSDARSNYHLGESSSRGSGNEHQVTLHGFHDKEIVGYANHKEKLVDQLIKSSDSSCVTISVVGPCGSGKTCLVKHTYESRRVNQHFDSYAWVQVSHFAKSKDLLSDVFMQLCDSKEPVSSRTLKSYLQQKRYLVVLDNILTSESWESIKGSLPGGSNGSRIIVTTQKSELADFCASSRDCIHKLTGLAEREAWDLFCKTAFRHDNGRCPRILKECSLKFLNRCEGSPLAIMSIAGLLSTKPKLQHVWEQLHESLGFEIGNHSRLSNLRKILLSSYRDLPSNLKSCFLYFSNILTEDNSVERGKLVRLWVAEKFVTKASRCSKTLEEIAEDDLNELVQRNLVHVTRWDADGRVGSVRVQNFFLEFIVQKAEEENFVFVSDKNTHPKEKVRRLLVKDDTGFSNIRDFSGVRSLLVSGSCSMTGDMIRNFSMLRVLDLQGMPLDEFPIDIGGLTLLRYLSLRGTNIKTIPKSIKKVRCLETLDLRQTLVTKVPKSILRLHNLRHLFIYRKEVQIYANFESAKGVEMVKGIGGLTNLQKLSLVKPDKKSRIIQELGALTQLVKLGLVGLKTDESRKLCASVAKMERLKTLDVSSATQEELLDLECMSNPPRHLQRLYLKGKLNKLPRWVNSSLQTLFRVVLKWSRLDTSPLKVLQKLPCLIDLQMVDAYTGRVLEFEARGFQKLKILHIEDFRQLHKVVIQDRAMPQLQKLTLSRCKNMDMLPLGINHLSCLEELLLYDMDIPLVSLLGKKNEKREMISHIPVIHLVTRGQNGQITRYNLS